MKPMQQITPIALLSAWFALLMAPTDAWSAEAGGTPPPSATISGRVANEATGAYLEGAVVEVQGTGRQVLTDRGGHYAIAVPPETTTLKVSYTGLDTQYIPLTLDAGRAVVRDIALTSNVYQLEKFVVEGEREGGALAITRQRQADNVKSVVATDAFGTMTDDNVGLFLERVTGINPETNTGTVRSVMVRGIEADLNTVSMDGVQLANTNSSGTNRAFDFLQASISMLESIEVTKAPTPDMPGNSIGGNINMVTRSIFSRKDPRSFTYSLGLTASVGALADVRWRAEPHRRWYAEPIKGLTPSVSLNYTDVVGEKKNIGLMLSYSSNIRFLSTYGSTPTYIVTPLGEPAPMTGNDLVVNPAGPSTRQNKTAKLEYKMSDRTLVSLTVAHSEYYMTNDGGVHNFRTNAASIVPGSSEFFTEARPSASTEARITQTAWQQEQNNYRFGAAVVHTLDNTKIDYTATLSKSDSILVHSSGPARKGVSGKPLAEIAVTGVRNIGWIIDRRQDPNWPIMTQTSGADAFDLGNYTSLVATQNNNGSDKSLLQGNINIQRNLRLAFPARLKTGLQYQEERRSRFANNFRHTLNALGGSGAPGGLVRFLNTDSWVNKTIHGQRQAPWLDPLKVARSIDENPEHWTEDFLYEHTQRLQNQVKFKESIGSAYAMGHVQLRNLGILAGLRVEETKTDGKGPKNQATLTPEESARRSAFVGPITDEEARRRAEYQLGQRAHGEGQYRNVFPGIHFKYAPKSGFVARASYSTSIGRPALTSIIANTTVNDTSQRVTIANPGLKPQQSENVDVSLEYYFEPIGLFSVGGFTKDVKNFIYSDTSGIVGSGLDNGFDGNFAGYGITTSANGGFAKYRGLELGYQQQFTFLPGFLSGFGLNMNFTRLETKGNYGGTVGTTKVANFRPKTANIAINYRRSNYDFRIQANWVDRYLRSVNVNPAQVTYEMPHVRTSAKFSYKLTGKTTLYLNWDNIFQEPIDQRYRGVESRAIRNRVFPSTIAAGVHGRF